MIAMSAKCQKRTLWLITSSAVARADAAWPGVYGRHRLEIKEGSRGGLRSLAPLLRGANIVQAHRRSDESKMRECLREIAKLPLRRRVVFFRQQAHVIAQREQTLEQGACFGIPMLQFVIVGKPKTAREKHAFSRRQAVDVGFGSIPQHEPINQELALDGRDRAAYPWIVCRQEADKGRTPLRPRQTPRPWRNSCPPTAPENAAPPGLAPQWLSRQIHLQAA